MWKPSECSLTASLTLSTTFCQPLLMTRFLTHTFFSVHLLFIIPVAQNSWPRVLMPLHFLHLCFFETHGSTFLLLVHKCMLCPAGTAFDSCTFENAPSPLQVFLHFLFPFIHITMSSANITVCEEPPSEPICLSVHQHRKVKMGITDNTWCTPTFLTYFPATPYFPHTTPKHLSLSFCPSYTSP